MARRDGLAIARPRRLPSPARSRDARVSGRTAERAAYHALVLDRRDVAILRILQEDARATYADLAQRVGLSPSSVHQRVRKLEERGVISGYQASVDPEALGLFVTALVSVTPLDPTQPDDLPQRFAELP